MAYAQPIAVVPEVLRTLVCSDAIPDPTSLHRLMEMAGLLRDFHTVCVDWGPDNASDWLSEIRDISQDIGDATIRRIFDDLFGSNAVVANSWCKYVHQRVSSGGIVDRVLELARQTPDQILLAPGGQPCSEGLRQYALETFVKRTSYGPECVLYRYPKAVEYKPRQYLSGLAFLGPYVRGAAKLEFCDRYLLTDEFVFDFISDVVRMQANAAGIVLRCDFDAGNPNLRFVFDRELRSRFPNTEVKWSSYNRASNHDRFIIVDEKGCSIRSTSSFNNIMPQKGGRYQVLKAFSLSYEQGRKYID